MSKALSLTIIDERNLRGVLGPPGIITKELLEDLIDFIELSAPAVVKDLEARMAEADRKNSWLSAEEVERRLKKRRKTRA